MATFNEIQYSIREGIKAYSDDHEASNEYLIYLFNLKRSKYLKQRLDRLGRNYDNITLQTLCLSIEEVSSETCGLNLTCDKIYRTTKPAPNFLQLSTGSAIQRVGPADKLSTTYNIIGKEQAPLFEHSYFTNKIKTFLDVDGYLYFLSTEPIFTECVTITGVFENPLDLRNYQECCDCDDSNICFSDDDQYPITPELIDLIRIEIIQELLKLSNPLLEDKDNNSDD
jgi:hypothetical protein|tara:strand:+ start:6250 stop:6927 length:678 start_codon:yes stop_codon:yes gene_type:complete